MVPAIPRVSVQPVARAEILPPPPRLLQYYLALLGHQGNETPTDIDMAALEALTKTSGSARQVAHQWTKFHMAVRLRFGQYALVNPNIAIRAWALPKYYGELLAVHDVLKARRIPHAFACITAAATTDYVPEAPLLITPHNAQTRTERIEAIRYDYARDAVAPFIIETLSESFSVPALDAAEAAIVFAALGTAREVSVARQLADEPTLQEKTAKRLNHFGLRLSQSIFRAEDPNVVLPEALEKRRAQLADSLLAEGIR